MSPNRSGILPADVYLASVPRKRMAAGALCRDRRGRILLVDPVYRTTWDLPGGVVEADESPHAACRRELAEEIGLDRPVGRVLAVDWVPALGDLREELVIIYDGGVLSTEDIACIAVPDDELAGFAFVSSDQINAHVRPVVSRRILACLEALSAGVVAALEDGLPIRQTWARQSQPAWSREVNEARHADSDNAIPANLTKPAY